MVPAILQSLDKEANEELDLLISTDNLGNRLIFFLTLLNVGEVTLNKVNFGHTDGWLNQRFESHGPRGVTFNLDSDDAP